MTATASKSKNIKTDTRYFFKMSLLVTVLCTCCAFENFVLRFHSTIFRTKHKGHPTHKKKRHFMKEAGFVRRRAGMGEMSKDGAEKRLILYTFLP